MTNAETNPAARIEALALEVKSSPLMAWDFIWRTENKCAEKVFSDENLREARILLPKHWTAADALLFGRSAASGFALPKGTHRSGIFQIQNDLGIWSQQDDRRIDFTTPRKAAKVSFQTWEEMEAAEAKEERDMTPETPETPEDNPIHNAIDALHAAFVGTPAEDAGTPIDFAQDITEVQPEPTQDPDSQEESLTLEEAILRECPGVGTSVRAIGYATLMRSEHIILAAEGSPFLVVEASSEGLGLGAIIRATEAGRARAAELGWTDAAESTPARLTPIDWDRLREIGHEPLPLDAPEEGSCYRCEDAHPLEDLGDGGLCSDCGVDLQEEEANRLQETHAAQTIPAKGNPPAPLLRGLGQALRGEATAEEVLQVVQEMNAAQTIPADPYQQGQQEAARFIAKLDQEEALGAQAPPTPSTLTVEELFLLARIEQLEAEAEGFRGWAKTQQVWTRDLEAEVQTLRAAAAVAAADSTRVFGFLESLHSSLGVLLGSESPATPKAPALVTPKAPKASPEGLVPIESVQPGAFMRRGDARRMLVRVNGATKVAFLSPTKGWVVDYRPPGWMATPYTPTAEERDAAHAALSGHDRTALGV